MSRQLFTTTSSTEVDDDDIPRVEGGGAADFTEREAAEDGREMIPKFGVGVDMYSLSLEWKFNRSKGVVGVAVVVVSSPKSRSRSPCLPRLGFGW